MCLSLARDAKILYKVLADQMPHHREGLTHAEQVVFIVGTQGCYNRSEVANVIHDIHVLKGGTHKVFSAEAQNSSTTHQLLLRFKEEVE